MRPIEHRPSSPHKAAGSGSAIHAAVTARAARGLRTPRAALSLRARRAVALDLEVHERAKLGGHDRLEQIVESFFLRDRHQLRTGAAGDENRGYVPPEALTNRVDGIESVAAARQPVIGDDEIGRWPPRAARAPRLTGR